MAVQSEPPYAPILNRQEFLGRTDKDAKSAKSAKNVKVVIGKGVRRLYTD